MIEKDIKYYYKWIESSNIDYFPPRMFFPIWEIAELKGINTKEVKEEYYIIKLIISKNKKRPGGMYLFAYKKNFWPYDYCKDITRMTYKEVCQILGINMACFLLNKHLMGGYTCDQGIPWVSKKGFCDFLVSRFIR